mmetsp:Transcript_53667/g.120511  ORF Transcript_53667/g.120511 Transcript_53667/m.120511 type:complete len:535 (-) Transcript_53667:53-1657(-)
MWQQYRSPPNGPNSGYGSQNMFGSFQGAWDDAVGFFQGRGQPQVDTRTAAHAAGQQRTGSHRLTPLEKHAREPGNQECADCAVHDPEWASVNQGTTLCMECAGVHRSLGTHISRVKSLALDSWSPEEVQGFIAKGGNKEVNKRLERQSQCRRPRPGAPRTEVDEYIAQKYQADSRSSSSASSRPVSQKASAGAAAKVGTTAHQGLAIVEVVSVHLEDDRVSYLKPLGALFLNLTVVVSLGSATAEPTSAKWSSATAVWEPAERKQLLWDCEERWLYLRVNDMTISGGMQLAGQGRLDVRDVQAEMQSWGDGEDMADVEMELYAPREEMSDEEEDVEHYVEHVVEDGPYHPGWPPPPGPWHPPHGPDNGYGGPGFNGRPRFVYNMRLFMMRLPSDHRRQPQGLLPYPPDAPPPAPGMETFVVGPDAHFDYGGYGQANAYNPSMHGGYGGPAQRPGGNHQPPPPPQDYFQHQNGWHPEGMMPAEPSGSDPALYGVRVGTARLRLTLIDMSGMTTKQQRKTPKAVGDGSDGASKSAV